MPICVGLYHECLESYAHTEKNSNDLSQSPCLLFGRGAKLCETFGQSDKNGTNVPAPADFFGAPARTELRCLFCAVTFYNYFLRRRMISRGLGRNRFTVLEQNPTVQLLPGYYR